MTTLQTYLREKLRSGKTTYGIFSYTGHSEVAEVAATIGIDFIVLDMEASPMTNRDVVSVLQGLGDSDCQGIVRIPRHDAQLINLALDIGAAGVMIPKVETDSEARVLSTAFRYPPLGTRGINAFRAQNYGAITDEEYMSSANEAALSVMQVESPLAISSLDVIVQNADIVFVGIGDLTLSSGVYAQIDNPGIIEARKKVVELCNQYGKIPGIFAGSAELANQFAKEGFKFIAIGNDLKHFKKGLSHCLEQLSSEC